MRYANFSSDVASVVGLSRTVWVGGGCNAFQALGFGGSEGLGSTVGRGGDDDRCICFGMERNTKKEERSVSRSYAIMVRTVSRAGPPNTVKLLKMYLPCWWSLFSSLSVLLRPARRDNK
jgi:hypothetical protein